MTKLGDLVRKIPYRERVIEIYRGKYFFRAYICYKNGQIISWTPLYHEDSRELEFMARARVDELVDGREHVIDNPMG